MLPFESSNALLSNVLIAEIAAGVPVVPAIDPAISTISLLVSNVGGILRIPGHLSEKLVISAVPDGSSVDDLVPSVAAMVFSIPAVHRGVATVPLVVSPIVFIVDVVCDNLDVLIILLPSYTNVSPRPMPTWEG